MSYQTNAAYSNSQVTHRVLFLACLDRIYCIGRAPRSEDRSCIHIRITRWCRSPATHASRFRPLRALVPRAMSHDATHFPTPRGRYRGECATTKYSTERPPSSADAPRAYLSVASQARRSRGRMEPWLQAARRSRQPVRCARVACVPAMAPPSAWRAQRASPPVRRQQREPR